MKTIIKAIPFLCICSTIVAEKEHVELKRVELPDLSTVWEHCKEYVLTPIVINIVNKKVADMEVGELSKTLETKIHALMGEFIKLGTAAKELSKNNGPKEELNALHKKMADIYHQVRPAESTVRGMYPKMVKLFDQLNTLYPDQYTQLDYTIIEEEVKTHKDGWFR